MTADDHLFLIILATGAASSGKVARAPGKFISGCSQGPFRGGDYYLRTTRSCAGPVIVVDLAVGSTGDA